jgi:hypothetical protein
MNTYDTNAPLRLRCGPRAIRLGAVALSLVAWILVSACGTQRPPPAATGGKEATSPSLSTADANWLTIAREKIIESCMQRRSVSYRPFWQDDFTVQLFPLVLTNPQWAEEYGFGAGNNAVMLDPNQQQAAGGGKKSVQFNQALHGVLGGPQLEVTVPGGSIIGESATGCYTYAQTRLYGNAAAWFGADSLATLGRTTAIEATERSATYQAAVIAWSGCMQRYKLNYASPQAAEEAATTVGQALPRGRTSIAVAEASCAIQTPLARISSAVYGEEVKNLPAIFQVALSVQSHLELTSVPRAKVIASASTGPSGG